jgi:limonene 1,2-monooxygenase
VFIAAAAQRTRHIRLGTGVIPLPIHHPLHVVDRLILLDHLTRGRAMWGFGAGGGLPSDHHIFGINDTIAHQRFLQSFDLITRLLHSDTPITETTDWYTLHDVVLQLRPYSPPHPQMAVASTNPELLERMGQVGGRVLTSVPPAQVIGLFESLQRGAASVGREASRQQISLVYTLHLADTREQAAADIRDGVLAEQRDFNAAVNGAPPILDPDAWYEVYLQRQIIGTPADAIATIEALLAQSGGFGGLLFRVKEWASPEATRRSYELFAQYVMPHFKGQLAAMQTAAQVAAGINHRA